MILIPIVFNANRDLFLLLIKRTALHPFPRYKRAAIILAIQAIQFLVQNAKQITFLDKQNPGLVVSQVSIAFSITFILPKDLTEN